MDQPDAAGLGLGEPVKTKPLARAFEGSNGNIEPDDLFELFFAEQPLEQVSFGATEVKDSSGGTVLERSEDGFEALLVQAERLLEGELGEIALPFVDFGRRVVRAVGQPCQGLPVEAGLEFQVAARDFLLCEDGRPARCRRVPGAFRARRRRRSSACGCRRPGSAHRGARAARKGAR